MSEQPEFAPELNDEQRRAVEAPDGPVMIVAGPGTGKTKTLVARVGFLVQAGRAQSKEILVLTFTAKAAAEVRERLAGLLGRENGVRVGTFHAVGLEALAEDGRRFASESQRLEVIRALPKSAGLSGLPTRELALRLSRHKNAADDDAATAELARAYDAALGAQGLRDFDDVLVAWREQLDWSEGVGQWRYVLIDEFQDTSEVQYQIARRLAPAGNLFVIGDPWQSIYGFRGAGAGMFGRFATDFPAHLAVGLTINYRSHNGIVQVANEVSRGENLLVAHATQAGRVRLVETLSAYSEADFVVGEIERALGGTDLARVDSAAESGANYVFRDIAVIHRTHRAARALVRRLSASGLPYQVAGGEGPYGPAPMRKVAAVLRDVGGEPGLAMEYGGLELAHVAATLPADLPVSRQVNLAAERLGITGEDERLAVAGLAAALVRFDGRPDAREQAAEYLAGLETNEFYDPAADAITVLTIHAAKGLEFPLVFVLGANEGGLPHLRADGRHDIDEERRLFYVAVTRAKERLDVVWPREREGGRVAPSRFLDGLTAERITDPMMASLVRKRTTSRAKRAQGSLF